MVQGSSRSAIKSAPISLLTVSIALIATTLVQGAHAWKIVNLPLFFLISVISYSLQLHLARTRFRVHRFSAFLLAVLSIYCAYSEYSWILVAHDPFLSVLFRVLTLVLMAALPWISGKKDSIALTLALFLNLVPPFSITLVGGLLSRDGGWLGSLIAMVGIAQVCWRRIVSYEKWFRFEFLIVFLLILLQFYHCVHGIQGVETSISHMTKQLLIIPGAFFIGVLLGADPFLRRRFVLGAISWGVVCAFFVLFAAFKNEESMSFTFAAGVNANTIAILWAWLACICFILPARIYGYIPMVFSVIFIVLTFAAGTRAATIAIVGTGLLLLLELGGHKFGLKRTTRSAILLLSLALGCFSIAGFVLVDPSESNSIRRILWNLSIAGIFESPGRALFGSGHFGPYFLTSHHSPFVEVDELVTLVGRYPWILDTHPHSDLISRLYGHGLLGFFIYLLICIKAIFRLSQHRTNLPVVGLLLTQVIIGVTDPTSVAIVSGVLFWIPVFFGIPAASTIRRLPERKMKRLGPVLVLTGLVLIVSILSQRKHKEVSNFINGDHGDPIILQWSSQFYQARASIETGGQKCLDLCTAYRLQPMGSVFLRTFECLRRNTGIEIPKDCSIGLLEEMNPYKISTSVVK